LRYVNEYIAELIGWLENAKDYKESCNDLRVNVMNGYPAVEGKTGSGFGVYLNGNEMEHPIIMIAGEAPEEFKTYKEKREFFCRIFLHEFKHHLQWLENPESAQAEGAEEDADRFAEEMYKNFVICDECRAW
jgi:hypothetical protein